MSKAKGYTVANSWMLIPASFFVAFILTLLPMPEWTVWLRPAWVLMVSVYWIVMLPDRFGMGFAWIIGLLLDLLNGSLFGEHALAMVVMAFFAIRMQIRFRMFPWMQQGFGILLLALVYQIILFCIQGFSGQSFVRWLYWLSPVTSMLLWPWVFNVLRHGQRRFGPIQPNTR